MNKPVLKPILLNHNQMHIDPTLANQQRQRGEIQLIVSCMFSGKSSEIIRRVRRFEHANKTCLVIKFAEDTRYDSCASETTDAPADVQSTVPANAVASAAADAVICTHNLERYAALSVSTLDAIPTQRLDESDVIAIDEGQFFDSIATFAEFYANRGKIVLIAALDGDFKRQPFPNILPLYSLCESVTKLNAICDICKQEAAFTARLVNDNRIKVIGGMDKYMAACRNCHTVPGKLTPRLEDQHSDVPMQHKLNSLVGNQRLLPPFVSKKRKSNVIVNDTTDDDDDDDDDNNDDQGSNEKSGKMKQVKFDSVN